METIWFMCPLTCSKSYNTQHCTMPFRGEQLIIYMHSCVCLTSSFNRFPRLLHTVYFSFMGFFCILFKRLFIMRPFAHWKKWSPNQKQKKKIKQEKQAQFRAGLETMVYFSC